MENLFNVSSFLSRYVNPCFFNSTKRKKIKQVFCCRAAVNRQSVDVLCVGNVIVRLMWLGRGVIFSPPPLHFYFYPTSPQPRRDVAKFTSRVNAASTATAAASGFVYKVLQQCNCSAAAVVLFVFYRTVTYVSPSRVPDFLPPSTPPTKRGRMSVRGECVFSEQHGITQ